MISQHYGTVQTVEWVTPHLARIVFDGDGLANFQTPDTTDTYINVAVPAPGAPFAGEVFDLNSFKGEAQEDRPYRRRYTVRGWDGDARLLTIDFVVHGESGVAGPWAANARPGDVLVFTGPAGSYLPDPEADWHLLVGDESALPAIGASLERIPTDAPVVVRLLCDAPEYECELQTPGRLDLRWLHRTGSGADEQMLMRSVAEADLPAGRAHAFIHGEAEETRAVRRHLLSERSFSPEQLSCSPYWKRGYGDDDWRKIKAAWVAEVENDVPDPATT